MSKAGSACDDEIARRGMGAVMACGSTPLRPDRPAVRRHERASQSRTIGGAARGRSAKSHGTHRPPRRTLLNLAAFLMGDGCEWLTGQTIALDGRRRGDGDRRQFLRTAPMGRRPNGKRRATRSRRLNVRDKAGAWLSEVGHGGREWNAKLQAHPVRGATDRSRSRSPPGAQGDASAAAGQRLRRLPQRPACRRRLLRSRQRAEA